MFEAIEVRLELRVADAPVLAGAVRCQVFFAIARERAAAGLEVPRQEAPGEAAPVHRGAADAFAGTERAELAHRQRGLVGVVAEADGLARQILHQLVALHIPQLVMRMRHAEIGIGVAPAPALEADDAQSRFRELLGEDGARESDADHHHIHRLEFGRHGQSFLTSSTCFGWPVSSSSARFSMMSTIEIGSAS